MWIQLSWLKHLSKNELQIASYIESWYVAMPSGERKTDAKCFTSIETMAKALGMNESSLRTALSRMSTPDENGWRWLHERQHIVQKERKAIMQQECGARETQKHSTHYVQTIREIAPQMGKVEYLYLVGEWIPYLNRTELAIASYIHGFAKNSRVCWAKNKDIAKHLGLTTTQVSRNVKSLIKRGWLQEFPMEVEEEETVAAGNNTEQQTLRKRSKGIQRVITPFGDAPIFAHSSTENISTKAVQEHLLSQANALLQTEQLRSETRHSEPCSSETGLSGTGNVPPLHFEIETDAEEGTDKPVVFSNMNELQAFVEVQIRTSLRKLHSEYHELHSETEELRIEIRKLQTELQKLQTESGKLHSGTHIHTSLIPIQDKFTNSSITLSSTAPKPTERDSRIPSASLSKNASGQNTYRQASPLAPPQRPERYTVPEEELTGSEHSEAAKELLEWLRLEQPSISEQPSVMRHFERDVQFTGAASDEKRSRDEMLALTIQLLELPCVQGDVEFVKALITTAQKDSFWNNRLNCLTPKRLLEETNGKIRIVDVATRLKVQNQRVVAQERERQELEISQMTMETFLEQAKKYEQAREAEIERQAEAFLAGLPH